MERKNSMQKPSNLVQSVERVANILELVGQNSQGMAYGTCLWFSNFRKGQFTAFFPLLFTWVTSGRIPPQKNYFSA